MKQIHHLCNQDCNLNSIFIKLCLTHFLRTFPYQENGIKSGSSGMQITIYEGGPLRGSAIELEYKTKNHRIPIRSQNWVCKRYAILIYPKDRKNSFNSETNSGKKKLLDPLLYKISNLPEQPVSQVVSRIKKNKNKNKRTPALPSTLHQPWSTAHIVRSLAPQPRIGLKLPQIKPLSFRT